jgi:hypothetical protein
MTNSKDAGNPFKYIKSINTKEYSLKDNLDLDVYNPYLTNINFSLFPDSIFHANMMNTRPHVSKKMNYDFYFYGLRKKNRFKKWPKKSKENFDDVRLIQSIYKYNITKAKKALAVLSDEQIQNLREQQEHKGG